MGDEWPLVLLGDFVEVKTGYPFKSSMYSTDSNGVRLLRGDNVVQGTFRWQNVKLWPENEIIEKHNAYWLQENDVILAMDRPWIEAGLKTSQTNKSDLPCLLVQRVACLRVKEGMDQNFLRYLISSYWFVEYVKLVQTGTAVPHISPKQIKSYEFRIPTEYEQKEIGSILRSLDDKIELNRQMNATLESMAQALFKSWFVDFDPVIDNALAAGNPIPEALQARAAARQALSDKRKPLPETIQQQFPNSFVFSEEMGWVPEGWAANEVKDFIEVTDYVANGSFAALKENVKLYDEPNYALYVRTTDFRHGFDQHSAKYVDKSSYDFLRKSFLDGSDVIINNVGNGVGTVFRPPCWLASPMTLGANAIALKTKGFSNFIELYFTSHQGQHQISSIVSGSAQPKFNKTDFRSLRVYFGSESLVAAFEEITEKFSTKKDANRSQLTQLANLRDTLLPKLLSGQLRIPEAEKQLAEAI